MLAERLQRRAYRKPIATEIARNLGHECLFSMCYRQQACDMIERTAEVVAVTEFDSTRVQRHAYADGNRLGPRLGMQCLLCGKPGHQRLRCGGKRCAKRV